MNPATEPPLCERILVRGNWRLVHAYDTALEGWLVLVHDRKIMSLAEMSPEDALHLGELIRAVSAAVQQVTGAVKTYVMQFAESPQHPYVHVHIVPRHADMPQDRRGAKVFGYLGVPEEQVVSLERRNGIAGQLRQILLHSLPG